MRTQRSWLAGVATLALLLPALGGWLALAPRAMAQETTAAAEPDDADVEAESDDLQALVAPVALFPDPMLTVVLQATVFPLQVVQADRFLQKYARDNTLQPPDDLDPAVIALLNYPQLIGLMNEYLDWTEAMGDAVVDQLDETQLAIQDIRRAALALGMLQDTDQQRVIEDGAIIRIMPRDPKTIAIPKYDPALLLEAMAEADDEAAAAEAQAEDAAEAVEAAPAEPAEAAVPAEPAPAAAEAQPAPAEPAPAPAAPEPAPAATAVVEPAPAPTAYAQSYAPVYPAQVPVAYSEPAPSYWNNAAWFGGGAAVGGLLGYAIGDDWFDDDDDNDNNDVNIHFDDDDWDDFRNRFDDDDWDDLGDRLNGRGSINIEDSNIIVGGDRIGNTTTKAKLKRDRTQNELRARREGDKVAAIRAPDGTLKRPARTGDGKRDLTKAKGKGGTAPVKVAERRPEAVAKRPPAEKVKRDVRLPKSREVKPQLASAERPATREARPTKKVASKAPDKAAKRPAAARPASTAKPAAAKPALAKAPSRQQLAQAQTTREVARDRDRGAGSRQGARPAPQKAKPQAAAAKSRPGGALKAAGGSGQKAKAASDRGKASRGAKRGGGNKRK
ncbi:MAG: DUF3300 domain-containing protein [Geminicoccaceae bacterium]